MAGEPNAPTGNKDDYTRQVWSLAILAILQIARRAGRSDVNWSEDIRRVVLRRADFPRDRPHDHELGRKRLVGDGGEGGAKHCHGVSVREGRAERAADTMPDLVKGSPVVNAIANRLQ